MAMTQSRGPGFLARLREWLSPAPSTDERMTQLMQSFLFDGHTYSYGIQQTLAGGKTEEPERTFEGLVQGAYKTNGIVFAVMLSRLLLFAEARFQFRRMIDGRPGELFGTEALRPLERPWVNGATDDLLSRMIQDADIAGNAFNAKRVVAPGVTRIRRMRPDWVTILMGSMEDPDVDGYDLDAEVIGFIYHPGGLYSGRPVVPLLASEVSHFAPIPDPLARYRGMSWLEPVIREIVGDTAASAHKVKFFENGATPNMVVALDPAITGQAWKEWVEAFDQKYGGLTNAYRTMYLGAGAKVDVVGGNLQQLDFKAVQGAGETRIAAAGGVPPIIVGLSEGLASATYSNYGQARRRFADGTMRPLWRKAARALEPIIDVPAGAELWYDDRDIPFLAEDQQDAASILQTRAGTVRTLVDAGFEPVSVISAVEGGDLNKLKHTNLYSVQLQPPGSEAAPKDGATKTDAPKEPPARFFLGAGDDELRHPGHSPQSVHAGKGKGALDYGDLEAQAEAGGFSVTLHGNVPSTGCMVSPYKHAERVYDVSSFSSSDVKAYRDNHRDLLSRPDHYLGGWRDGDQVYLDVSIHAKDRAGAHELAVKHGQLAYYDIGTGETVYTTGAAAA